MPETAPCPLQQSPLFAAALARMAASPLWYALPGGPVLAVTRTVPVLGRIALISRPGPALPQTLRRALGVGALIVNAETQAQGAALARAGFVRLATGREVAELSLAGTPENWLARMDGKWRNRLRHAQRQGLELRAAPLPPDRNHWLFHREAAQQAARGYRNLPPALIAAMAAAEPGALTLFTARAEGRSIAAMLFARHGSSASYLIGWSDAAGRATSAHNLLFWTAMDQLRAIGVQVIDLGSCDAQSAPGLARFKLGSGSRARRLGGTWVEVGALTPLHVGLRTVR
ncbi:GNAT family N-acetyltransferase [Roseicyclus mahoneyensis]|uniref:Acetyltransferase (GNAT) family protein n=1 Tax=Roseicyclus mahoneyensis TaxID=164332 RepID=A0A316H5H8_9RHOB|nr:GNAT family N-acetyltransferase [Roseicyclus mahoneyensis]PWK62833.1 acetyltransferase (GNAT) family protein [Roseicyclus mahoneyensis]